MRTRTALAALLAAMAALILDSPCAARSASDALELCLKTLIPGLFPLFVVSAMLVPQLSSFRLPFLARLLGIPDGSEGIFLLGCAGGFPVGAACIAQTVPGGALAKQEAERMLGLCSFCGPSFLFGVIAAVLGMADALTLFALQLETALLVGAFWPGPSRSSCRTASRPVSVTEAVRRSIGSMASVCAWVILAGVTAGFLRRWLFPLLPASLGILLTGLLELTNGVFSLPLHDGSLSFVLCAAFVCFGGVSVLLQIGALAAAAGLGMGTCILQKAAQATLAALLALMCLRFGRLCLLLPFLPLAGKIAVEIPGRMVYNSGRKEGI